MIIDFNANYFIDLDELHTNIMNDFSEVTHIEQCLDSAENIGVDMGIFSNVCSIFPMSELNHFSIEQQKNINKNDKYIIEDMNFNFSSVDESIENDLKKLAERTYQKIVEKIKNNESMELLNQYLMTGIELSLIEKQ